VLKEQNELPRLDVEKATKAIGNRYLMILEAARRARIIAHRRDALDRKNEKLGYYGYKPINAGLKDIIDEYETGL
jgi:DNA-directed RNA polymerase subunit K/omega